jgi:hypothetical protein
VKLRNSSLSETDHQILGDLGRAGQTFNDVISELIALYRLQNIQKLNYGIKKLQTEQRPLNHAQTVSSPVNSDA